MDGFLDHIEYWQWLGAGLGLILVEIFAPSAIFLWPGVAALIVGVLSFAAPHLDVQALLLLWAALSVALAFGFQVYRKRKPSAPTDAPALNRRGEQYVGRHFTLARDILNGVGELHVDDTRWKIVSGKDLPMGAKVKVTGVEGTSLRVEEYIS